MTFSAPWRLALLLAPLALAAVYVIMQSRRHRTVVRFTSVDLLASVAPRRPGWQRHIPGAALLAALMLLVLGVAQPARTVRTARQRATVMLAIDTSGSMVANDVAPTRLAAAQKAARAFVNALPAGVQLGLVSFSSNAAMLVSPTTDRSTVLAAVNNLTAGGATATADAIDLSLEAIRTVPAAADGKAAPAAIVLISDGTPTVGRGDLSPTQAVDGAATAAKQAGVPITTIAYGTADGAVSAQGQLTPVPSDPAAMAQIASESGGRTFTAQSANQLESVYNLIGRAVGYDVHHLDITVWFTAIALLTGLAAGAAALVWTQRLI